MLIYTNGCSHTRGTPLSLDNDHTKAWPYLVAQHHDAELVNDSRCGASNDSIVQSTMEYILSNLENLPDQVNIQFTVLDRFDTGYVTHLPRSSMKVDNKYNNFYGDFFPRGSEMDKVLSHKLINQVILLSSFLRTYGIHSKRFLIWTPLDREYVTYESLPFGHTLFNVNRILSKHHKMCQTPDPGRGGKPDGHFGRDAHKRIAGWITNTDDSYDCFDVDKHEEKDYNFIDHIY